MTDLYLRTAIREQTKRQTFKKSCLLALLAGLFVAAFEFFLPLMQLESFLLYSRLIGTSVFSLGALSHQKLKSQDKNPDVLHSTEEELSLFQANKALFTLAWNEIESFHYVDNGNVYGLAFTLKTPLNGMTEKCRKEHGVDLFLPYFSQASYLLLEKWRDQHVCPNP